MAFEFVEEYYDPLTITECMVESYGEGIRISTDLDDEETELTYQRRKRSS